MKPQGYILSPPLFRNCIRVLCSPDKKSWRQPSRYPSWTGDNISFWVWMEFIQRVRYFDTINTDTYLSHAHSSARYWPDPYEFKPSRFLDEDKICNTGAFKSFSAGLRACTGRRFVAGSRCGTLATLISLQLRRSGAHNRSLLDRSSVSSDCFEGSSVRLRNSGGDQGTSFTSSQGSQSATSKNSSILRT